jgi:hypothetical protein
MWTKKAQNSNDFKHVSLLKMCIVRRFNIGPCLIILRLRLVEPGLHFAFKDIWALQSRSIQSYQAFCNSKACNLHSIDDEPAYVYIAKQKKSHENDEKWSEELQLAICSIGLVCPWLSIFFQMFSYLLAVKLLIS